MLFSTGILADSKSKQLYIENCMVCHGEDGGGAMPGLSDLTESRTWINMPANDLLLSIKKGITKTGNPISMPPNGGNKNLTDTELLKIIGYMRNKFN